MPLKDTTKFASAADIRQKVNGTILTYDGVPCYCMNNGDSDKIEVLGLILDKKTGNSQFRKTIEYNDPLLSIQSPNIGYMNVDNRVAIYLSRVPSRRFTIGLTRECFEFKNILGNSVGSPFGNWPYSEELHKTISNNFESPLNILNRLYNPKLNTAWSQAFSRTLAFGYSEGHGLRVFHKNTPIAYYNPKDKIFCSIKPDAILVENILVKHGIKNYAS